MNTSEARQQIGRRLAGMRSGIRRAQWKRGGLLLVTVVLGGLLALMAAEQFFGPLPPTARWVLFGSWLVGILAAAWAGLRPLLRKIGLVQVARWIEGRHPEIEERMSTVLELGGGHAGASPELLEALARAAGEDIGKVDTRAEMNAVRAGKRWARPALVLACITVLLFSVWPRELARLAVRAVAPFSTVGNAAATKFTIIPGNVELLEGDALAIEAGYEGPAEKLDLVMEMANGSSVVQPMSREGDRWHYRMDPVRESFRYRARAGRGESDGFTATVWPLPGIAQPRLKLEYPDYAGVLPLEEPLGRGIESIRGTRAALSGVLNTAVEAAWLEIGGERASEAVIDPAADGGRIRFSWTLDQDGGGEAVVWLKHRLGREVDALRFPVRVLEDTPPRVRWLSPMARELRVRPDELLGLRYEVTEDFGVALVQIEAKTSGKDPVRLPQDLPERFGSATKPSQFRGAGELAVGALLGRWPGTAEIRLRVRAVDARPAEWEGPGVGHSEWLLLRIDHGAESLARQEMRAEHDGARETIEQAMRAAREARERMDWHRGEMERQELSKEAVKHFEEARDRLAAARQKLDELLQRMGDSVHATKAEEVREASEQLAQARQELESAPLQDGKQQREEKLDHAREQSEAAVKKLEEVRNRMDQDRQKIEELARLQELAQQQKELARQAEQQAGEQAQAEPLPEDWQNRQHNVEEALRQQLREQPQARAEVLARQAEEANRLSTEARELSEAQRALAQQSRQMLAETPPTPDAAQSVRSALEKEQAKIAAEAARQLAEAQGNRSEAADLLPEAVAEAKQASEALSKGEDQAAAESAKEAAQAMREAARPEGQSEQGQSEQAPSNEAGLRALAERQEKVAAALQSLSKGETAGAMKELQQIQADQAAGLDGAVAEMPQAEGSGPMHEARDSSRQGNEQAQAAAASGQQGKAQDAAGQHQQSGDQLGRSAEALGRAAGEFRRAAEQARGQQPEQHRAAIPPGDLAEAFQAASRAAGEPQAPQAADQASQAAEALSRAAQAARQSMQGRGTPGQSGMPQPPGNQPGEKPGEGPRAPEADPGVPPELAKLGISAAAWEKIQATLKSDVGAGAGAGVPEEYRGLVKEYFKAMADE